MKIVTPSPVRTATRVRQLASTFPLECANALASQPDAIANVGRALAHLADEPAASEVLARALRLRPDLSIAARPFYDRRLALLPPTPVPAGYVREITTDRQRP